MITPIETPMAPSPNRAGTSAVPFDLPDTNGKPHRLEDHRGRWLLLMFHRHLA
jgi:peroxiredoxin